MSRNAKGETIISIPKTAVKKEQMTTVVWTTPLGLPIVQPYRKIIRKQIKTAIQSVYISDPNANAEGMRFSIIVMSCSKMIYSEWRETGFRFPSQLYPQSRCYTYDAHCPGMPGLFPTFEIMKL